jgi:hypothetical protein
MRCLIKGVIKTHLMSIFTKRSMLNGDPIICQRIQVEIFIQLALRCMKLFFFSALYEFWVQNMAWDAFIVQHGLFSSLKWENLILGSCGDERKIWIFFVVELHDICMVLLSLRWSGSKFVVLITLMIFLFVQPF